MGFLGGLVDKITNTSAPKLKKRSFDPEAMSIEDIKLPECLEQFNISKIKDILDAELETFKYLGYKDKVLEDLRVPEYHSLQIGIMLRYLKADMFFIIPNIEKILPSYVLGATKKELHKKVFDIVYRYDNGVSKDSNIKNLEDEIKWTPQDAAYLLRYIGTENRKG